MINLESIAISIVLPVYNGSQYIRESIESCLTQTFRDWELIIVNDCSTDESGAIAEEYAAKDERVRVIHNTTNLKLPGSLNVGFRFAKGEYLTWTSDDNRFLPNALQRMIDFLRGHQEYQMVCAAYTCIDSDGKSMNCDFIPLRTPLICGNSVGACFLYTRKVYETIGEYDTSTFLLKISITGCVLVYNFRWGRSKKFSIVIANILIASLLNEHQRYYASNPS